MTVRRPIAVQELSVGFGIEILQIEGDAEMGETVEKIGRLREGSVTFWEEFSKTEKLLVL